MEAEGENEEGQRWMEEESIIKWQERKAKEWGILVMIQEREDNFRERKVGKIQDKIFIELVEQNEKNW